MARKLLTLLTFTAFATCGAADYFPPPDAQGGWRTLPSSAAIRKVAGLDTERLEQAFRSQETFIADASHQLKTPLSILRGEIDLMRSRARTPEEVAELKKFCRLTDAFTFIIDEEYRLNLAHVAPVYGERTFSIVPRMILESDE